jgi:hypothetical protein
METITDQLSLLVRMAHMTDEEVICNSQQWMFCSCGCAARDSRVADYFTSYTNTTMISQKFLVFPSTDAYMRFLCGGADPEHAPMPENGIFCVGCGVVATQETLDRTHFFRPGEPNEPVRIER